MTNLLMAGDIVTVDLRVKFSAEPGDQVTLTAPESEYSSGIHLPFEHCALRIPFLKTGDVVAVSGPEHHLVTVIHIDGDSAWVKEDDGRRETYRCGDLERLPPKRTKSETPPTAPAEAGQRTEIGEEHF